MKIAILLSARRVASLRTPILPWILIGCASIASGQEIDASYQDRIYLVNGDRVTGNLKELDRGKLRVKTRTMDDVFINWVDVKSIESDKYLRIVRRDGSFTNGRLEESDIKGVLGVLDHGVAVDVELEDVTSMRSLRVDQSFVERLEGDIKAGIDYKKATDVLLVNVASNLRLREERYEIGFGFDWNDTRRNEDNTSTRINATGDYTAYLRNRWFWRGAATAERNDELGLQRRVLTSASAGRYLLLSNRHRWEVNAGLAGNFEEKTDGTSNQSAEGVFQTTYDIFVHKVPVTRLVASAVAYPSLTDSGRLRVNTNISLRNEIIRSLFWDLSFYSNYDNRPAEGAQKTDYGIVTSIGTTF